MTYGASPYGGSPYGATGFAVAEVQLLRPTSDISPGPWTASSGTDRFAMIDEVTASSADYITTSSTGTGKYKLTPGALDPLSSTGHTLRVEAQSTGGGLTVQLVQGAATVICSFSPAVTGTYAIYPYTLSGAECDAITDYTDLYLWLTST